MLKWRTDSNTNLTFVCRHRWSRQMTMKVDRCLKLSDRSAGWKLQAFIYFHRHLSAPAMSTDNSQVGVAICTTFLTIIYIYICICICNLFFSSYLYVPQFTIKHFCYCSMFINPVLNIFFLSILFTYFYPQILKFSTSSNATFLIFQY